MASGGSARGSFEARREARRHVNKLHEKIKANDVEGVRQLLADNPKMDVDVLIDDNTALQLVVMSGQNEIVQILVDRGADVNRCDEKRFHLLHMCCWNNRPETFDILVKGGAELEVRNDDGQTPLSFGTFRGVKEIVRIALANKADVNATNNSGETPLMLSGMFNQQDIMRQILAAGALIEQKDYLHRTAIANAANNGNSMCVNILIQAGASINTPDRYGQTPLFICSQQGYQRVVNYLLRAGADVNRRSNNGATPFYEAVRNKHLLTSEMLARSGADVNINDRSYNQSPLHLAVRLACQYHEPKKEHLALVQLILDKGGNASVTDRHGWTPLYQSSFSGEVGLSRMLLEAGASVQYQTENGETAMHTGVYGNELELVRMLFERGASITGLNKRGETPLYLAVTIRDNPQIAEYLLECGADINVQEKDTGKTPLCGAAFHKNREHVKLLLRHNADANIADHQGNTAVCLACTKGVDRITHILLDHPNIDVNKGIRDFPLRAAALAANMNLMNRLLLLGADPNKVTIDNKTAIQACAESKFMVGLRMLVNAGGNPAAHHATRASAFCCKQYVDSHPHLETEAIYAATKNDNIPMLDLLLLATPRMPYGALLTLKDILFRTGYTREAELKTKLVEEFSEFFSAVLSAPRALQMECRGVIRERLGSRPNEKVKSLPLPVRLQEYILLVGELEEAEEEAGGGKSERRGSAGGGERKS